MLTELAMRILSELEEAGEENVAAMLNTVIAGTGSETEISDYQQALRELIHAGLAAMSIERDATRRLTRASRELSDEQINGISAFLEFDDQRALWSDSRIKGPPFGQKFPLIVITEAGREKSVQILKDRGHGWWHQKA